MQTVRTSGWRKPASSTPECLHYFCLFKHQTFCTSFRLPSLAVAPSFPPRLAKYGRIAVNDEFRTSVPNVYAIGDVVGGGLASVASKSGRAVARMLFDDSLEEVLSLPCLTFSHRYGKSSLFRHKLNKQRVLLKLEMFF
jgi:hypothetical protein